MGILEEKKEVTEKEDKAFEEGEDREEKNKNVCEENND